MANEDKIRVLEEIPVMGSSGLKYARTYAGPSDATKPTADLANGSFYIKTDAKPLDVATFDEVSEKWSDEE